MCCFFVALVAGLMLALQVQGFASGGMRVLRAAQVSQPMVCLNHRQQCDHHRQDLLMTITMEKLFCSADVVLVGKDGTKTKVSAALAGKDVVALYFSARWCPPCCRFTLKLAEAYKTIAVCKSFEIVFVSNDQDEAQFAAYHKEMPWLALPFEEQDLNKRLGQQFNVRRIPALILLDGSTGALLSKDGRGVVIADPTGANFPWHPRLGQDKDDWSKIILAWYFFVSSCTQVFHN